MTLEMIFVLALIVVAVALFASERFPVDLVALMIMGILLMSGIVTPGEGISGFSNTATVTVGAMFILSTALMKTGVVNAMGAVVTRLYRLNFWIAIVLTMMAVGLLSAFVNNTPVVAIFLPIMLGVARSIKKSPSKLLMPLSFAGMLGGTCTLIGTSTNILVSSIAERSGQPGFQMFEFAPLGFIIFAVGTAYMVLLGVRLIPDRRGERELSEDFGLGEYITEIILEPNAASVGKKLSTSPLVKEVGVQVLDVIRDKKRLSLPPSRTELQKGDILRIVGDVEKIKQLQEREGIRLRQETKLHDKDLESEDVILAEAVVAPFSRLVGRTIQQNRFRDVFGATVLAIRHRGTLMKKNLEQIKLRAGDALLLEVRKDTIDRLMDDESFVFVSEVGLPMFRKNKALVAIGIVLSVIILAALNVVSILVGAIMGCVLLVMSGCITLEEAYQAIDWRVIFLLAGALTLGVALEKTGAARLVAELLISSVGVWGPIALVSAFYLLTSLLTEAMSNNATAVLLAPIAISAAELTGVSPRPLLMAVAFAASASFMTPVGYQTNTMIYGVGHYRFADFLKVGTPLNILCWILATLFIPYFWPF
ncbi:MAG TPA: SLC13 family permease [Bacteroidota bacterium]|nr:SLC13 family permease [Bacteroidota bacterium]